MTQARLLPPVPRVSIVIPVCNVERYLPECLESALAQTLSDIEVICVDDGSTDGSLKILQRFAARDSRVQVIEHRVNQGLPVARNTGMEAARGSYLFFLDSDDRLQPDILRKAAEEAVSSGADIVATRARAFLSEPGDPAREKRVEGINAWLSSYGALRARQLGPEAIAGDPPTHGVAWGKLFSRRFIDRNALRFMPYRNTHEDEGFWLKCLACQPMLASLEDIGVLYRIRTDSIMGSQRFGTNRDNLMRAYADAIAWLLARPACPEKDRIAQVISRRLAAERLPFEIQAGQLVLERRHRRQIYRLAKYRLLSHLAFGHARRRYLRRADDFSDIHALAPFLAMSHGHARLKELAFSSRLLLLAAGRLARR